MKPDEVEATRRQIATALERRLEPHVRSRLVAIDMRLSGHPIEDAAAYAVVRPNTVRAWLRVVTRDGIVPTLARWEGQGQPRPRKLDVDPATLRELAAKERNPRIRKRMLALACVAEGMNPLAAAVSVGVAHGAVLARVKRYQKEGAAGFQDRKIAGRPHKLDAAQFQELRLAVLERPDMSYEQLRDLVWARFRVRYSHASLKRVLKKEFGIVWTGSSKKMGEGLNLTALQAAVDDAENWRMKERLKALLQLAKGGEAETVARANGVHLETLREWARRYRRFGIEGLRGKRPEHDGRPPKLSPEQRGILREWIVEQSEIDEERLCTWVKVRFGVSYSPAYMRRLACAARTAP